MRPPNLKSQAVLDFCQENDIASLAVFGSFANGTATEDSDLDLLVRFEGRVSLLDLIRVERELSELLGQKVDLVTEGSLSPYIRDSVLAQAGSMFVSPQPDTPEVGRG